MLNLIYEAIVWLGDLMMEMYEAALGGINFINGTLEMMWRYLRFLPSIVNINMNMVAVIPTVLAIPVIIILLIKIAKAIIPGW